jgi:hypothetical protein
VLLAWMAAALLLATTGATVSIGQQPAGSGIWEVLAERPAAPPQMALTGQFAVARLNRPAFAALVQNAPAEGDATVANTVIITIPMPDGSFGTFTVMDSPILAPELAAAFPAFRTFSGQGVSDPTATARFGWTDFGFHAIVISASGTTYVDPYDATTTDLYVSVSKANAARPRDPFICNLPGSSALDAVPSVAPVTNGATLRTYRLAMAATGEYTTAAGGTVGAALGRIVTTMNRVNGIYERELAVRMTVATGSAGNPTSLIFTNGGTDPYSNNDGGAMLTQNQVTVDALVGPANYDIGHVFSTGGGGVAYLQSVCDAGIKAGGVTGSGNPTGDAFDVDYVAHEIGHQFGGNHTFNSDSNFCSGNRSPSHASEVGSGSTIQAYAGICNPENLQPNSDDYFTFVSLNEMTAFVTSGGGASCGSSAGTGNTAPSVSAGSNYTIPISTPFTLTASGSDPNGDTLTYAWEQHSFGTASNSVVSASTDNGSRPIMRSYLPTTSNARTFPKLTYILNNANTAPTTYTCSGGPCLTGEILPTTSRAITFQVTARDNRAGGGGIATASMIVTTTNTAGPFLVTAPNTAVTLSGGATSVVTWNPANTAAAPVSAANVRILLSTDGGTSFPTVLAASTPNDGTQSVTIPSVATSTARIKIEAVDNVFFDISNTNFSITAAAPPTFTDDPLVAGTTVVKAVHITEMRAAIDSLRAGQGLGAMTWTDTTLTATSTVVKAVHITEMRTALDAVYTARGLTPPTHTAITATVTTVTAAHVTSLRNAILAIW